MKHIHNLYKLLIFFCATFLAQNVVAQAVEGNKYLMIDESSKVSTNRADITALTLRGQNAGRGDYVIRNAFDNNTGSWWKSTISGTINVDIDFGRDRTIRAFHFLSGGEPQERENELHVYSLTNGNGWADNCPSDRT